MMDAEEGARQVFVCPGCRGEVRISESLGQSHQTESGGWILMVRMWHIEQMRDYSLAMAPLNEQCVQFVDALRLELVKLTAVKIRELEQAVTEHLSAWPHQQL